MDHRLKERLTGAVILVALIVLLVPEMFHGQAGNITASGANSAEGPPERSYTIDLSNGATRTAPLQSSGPTVASGSEGSAPTAAPGSSMGMSAIAGVKSEASSAAAAPAASVAAVSTGAASAARPKVLEHVAAAGWSVQLGLFSQRDNAQRLVQEAQAKGFAVSLANADGKGPYRVRAAGLADRAAALALQQRLRTQGFAAAIVAP
ncbi:MAG: SPOR domain-containing protein [Steroidobacteraceae bacterium]|jgi:rare lipoprotein A